LVNSKTFLSPVCVAAIAAVSALYLAAGLPCGARFLRWAWAFALIAWGALTAWIPGASTQAVLRRRVALAAALGFACGLAASGSVIASRQPLRTLAPSGEITAVTVRLLGDPQPYGERLYRAPVRFISCQASLAGGSGQFSADGLGTVFFPSPMIRQNLPGGIGARFSPGVVYAQGLRVCLLGRFTEYDGAQGERFFADSDVPATAVFETPLSRFRSGLRLSLARVLYAWGDSGGFLLALFSANRDYLSPALSADFKTAGLSHVLALSGVHLSLLGLIAIRFGQRVGGKRVAIKLSVLAMVFFVWFAGLSPSLDRALLMAVMLVSLRRSGYDAGMVDVLALTAVVQCLLMPSEALSLGFALSYAALLGLLTVGERLAGIFYWVPLRGGVGNLSASVGATLLTAPILALTVGVIAPVGILATCVVETPSSVFLVGGMLAALVSVICPPAEGACRFGTDCLYQAIERAVSFFAQVPPLSTNGLAGKILAVVVSSVGVVLALLGSATVRKRRTIDDEFARL